MIQRQPADPLGTYRAKRDFSATPEPSGSVGPPAADGRRFVVQRHRARRLHYDLRLEVDGVLVSWAVPKGPTLDPKSRRLAVHVEDHPLDYFDFEGVIPGGEYGGGDVVVWDWGTWEPIRTEDPAAAIGAGELHFDLDGDKLKGRFVLIRRGEASAKEQWLLLHKNDDEARPGWDPEDHPRSVKSGRTNDEVKAEPDALWRSDRPAAEAKVDLTRSWQPPSEAELDALDALRNAGEWEFQDRVLKLTNLDKVLFPALDGEEPVTKRDLVRYHAMAAPFMLPYLVERPLNQHRFPNGADRPGFWHKALPEYAPEWIRRWHNTEADPGETEWYAVADSPPTLAWLANYGALELHAWTSTIDDVHRPTWAFIDIDPGPKNSFDDVVVLARLYRTALDHLAVVGGPKVTGQRGIQIWIPVADQYSFSDTRAWVETISRAVGATVPELVSWSWHKRDRSGLARLDYTQNAINRTLVAPFSAATAARSAGVRPDHLGRARRPRAATRPLDDPHRARPARLGRRSPGHLGRAPADPPRPMTHHDSDARSSRDPFPPPVQPVVVDRRPGTAVPHARGRSPRCGGDRGRGHRRPHDRCAAGARRGQCGGPRGGHDRPWHHRAHDSEDLGVAGCDVVRARPSARTADRFRVRGSATRRDGLDERADRGTQRAVWVRATSGVDLHDRAGAHRGGRARSNRRQRARPRRGDEHAERAPVRGRGRRHDAGSGAVRSVSLPPRSRG